MTPPRRPQRAGAPQRAPRRGPSKSAPELAALRRALLRWYRATARDLPWRRTRAPYHIWLSEIMLQQTRVETVLPYYARFLAAFPTVAELAAAPLDRVLKLWEGLGYYARGRNLHAAAQHVMSACDGRWPRTAAEWSALPGIGRYTAAAIASIAAGEPVATVDGNITRVLARLFRVESDVTAKPTRDLIWQHAETLLDRHSPGDFNQALMDLGARICTPRTPECAACPLAQGCAARAAGRSAALPRHKRRTPPLQIHAAAAIVCADARYLLVQRPAHGLLAGLWGWPTIALSDGTSAAPRLRAHLRALIGRTVRLTAPVATLEHVFTHRHLHLTIFAATLKTRQIPALSHPAARWLTRAQLSAVALATVDRKALAAVVARRRRAHPPTRKVRATRTAARVP